MKKKNVSNKKKHIPINSSLKVISPICFDENSSFYYEIKKYSFFIKFVTDQNNFKPSKDEVNYIEQYIKEKRNLIIAESSEKNFIFVCPLFKYGVLNLQKIPFIKDQSCKNIEHILNERDKNSNISLSKIREIYQQKYKENISRSKIYRIIRNKLHYSFKKIVLKPKKLERDIYKKMKFLFIKCIIRAMKLKLDFVFIDESCFKLKNNNYRDWIKHDDLGHFGQDNNNNLKKNFLLAVGTNNIINYKLTKKNTNSELFNKFFKDTIEKIPDSNLKQTVFVMDNLTSHINMEIKKVFERRSLKVLYTVPYESSFNPIELAFRAIKSITYKKIYKNISDLEKDITRIIKSVQFKKTLYKNFLETLEKYLSFIKSNYEFNMNQ